MTVLLRTRSELDAWLDATHGPRGVVLTMGALHEGHLVGSGTVMVTVFVNPAQFGPSDDFERYPRTLEADVARCATAGVDAVFAPSVNEVYPEDEPVAERDPGPLGDVLEGAIRLGHFAGVLKVVSRLLQLTRAEVTCFGEKDYQQLTLVRRLVDSEPTLQGCRVIGVPIVRDADGLAMSSRNRYLSDDEREAAQALPQCVELVRHLCSDGIGATEAARVGLGFLATASGVVPDYVVVLGSDMSPAPREGEGRVILAARVGSTRLLDNGPVLLKGRDA
jgi:pantoate--beta-alanine ligase